MQVFKLLDYYFKLSATILVTIYYAIKVILIISISGKKEKFFKNARKWSKYLLKICRIKVAILNPQNISESFPLIYISNHSSLFDIPIVLSVCNDDVAIMYKKELEKIPLFGLCLKVSPFIAIEREHPKSSLLSIEKAIEAVRGKYSVLIFPEGTRSEDGTIGEFKRGAFLLAARSGKPLMPIVIVGSNKILPKKKKTINSGEVKFIYTKLIYIENEVSRAKEIELMNEVRDLIYDCYQKHNY